MSNITFLQYTPHQEKKRPSNSSGACVNCRKAHTACNAWRPCDRCVRMGGECRTNEKKKKQKDATVPQTANGGIDVDTMSKMLFDPTKPTTPLQDPFALPSPLSNYITDTSNIELLDTPYTTPPDNNNATFATSFSFVPAQQISPTVPSNSPTNTFSETPYSPENIYTLSSPHASTPNTNAVTATNSQDKIDELIAQNARMEMLLSSLSRKVDYLQTQISPGSNSFMAPATASWKLPSCEMLECNPKFLELLGYNEADNSLTTFFQLGACTEAMQRIQNKIDHSIAYNEPINEPTYSHTLVVPMYKKSKEVVLLNISVVICLDAPFPVMTTILHRLPPGYIHRPNQEAACEKKC